jgi:VWFA-related protein
MNWPNPKLALSFVSLTCWLIVVAVSAFAQSPAPAAKSDEVVRVNTQLVQTDVLVFDKDGQQVPGLKATDFELKVNGKSRPVLFFDRYEAGAVTDEARMAAARGFASPDATGAAAPVFDRGRTIFFYLDDYHIASGNLIRLRELLTEFVEKEMGVHDEVGIITATGQLGFLEQLTGEKSLLLRAIGKLAHRSFQATDSERPAMSEAEAIAIMNEDRRILDYFIEQLLKDMGQPRPRQASGLPAGGTTSSPGRNRSVAESAVRARAKSIVDQSAALSGGALSGFEKFIRTTAPLPWQKLVFFVSDGFELAGGRSGYDLRLVSDAASRSGTVIYTIDTRGLITGSPEAAKKVAFDSTSRLASTGTRPVTAPQEVLRTIALDGGGDPILDSNGPLGEMKRAVSETAGYYQISWRPDDSEIRERKFQTIEIKVPGRSDVTIRTRQGFFFESADGPAATNVNPPAESNAKKTKEKVDNRPLSAALRSMFPARAILLSLSAGYLDTGEPTMLVTASLEVQKESLDLSASSKNIELDLAGVVIDESGKAVANFDEDLTVKPAEILSSATGRVVYNHQLRLPSGLYQLRAAVEDKKSARVGSAMQWLNIPNPKSGDLMLSSVFVGEVDAQTLSSGKLNINADHRFPLRSRMGFMTYVYNAKPGSGGPDLAIQVMVLREDQPVLTRPLVKVATNGLPDMLRIPYGEDFELGDLPAGRYVLQINAIDRVAKKTATQQARFSIH